MEKGPLQTITAVNKEKPQEEDNLHTPLLVFVFLRFIFLFRILLGFWCYELKMNLFIQDSANVFTF